jgi:hypothetical protein
MRTKGGLMGQSSVEWRKTEVSFDGGFLRVSTFDSQPIYTQVEPLPHWNLII